MSIVPIKPATEEVTEALVEEIVAATLPLEVMADIIKVTVVQQEPILESGNCNWKQKIKPVEPIKVVPAPAVTVPPTKEPKP